MNIFFIIILIIFIIWNLTQLYHNIIRRRAPWFPSSKAAQKAMLEKISLEPGQVFAEIGAGSAGIAKALATKYPQAKLLAYEIAYVPFVIGWLDSLKFNNLHFIRQDIISADLSQASIMYAFLNPKAMKALAEKFRQAPQNSTLYSYAFHLPGFEIKETIQTGLHPIYVYKLGS